MFFKQMLRIMLLFDELFLQIWSQNLEFSKLTEILYRDTLLYGSYDINVYFFKLLFIHIDCFGQIWSQNVPIEWNLAFFYSTNVIC